MYAAWRVLLRTRGRYAGIYWHLDVSFDYRLYVRRVCLRMLIRTIGEMCRGRHGHGAHLRSRCTLCLRQRIASSSILRRYLTVLGLTIHRELKS